MPARRKFKVRVRGKVRNQLLRRGGVAAGIALGLLLVSWLFGAGIKASRQFLESRLFSFRPEAFDIACPSAAAAASLRELAGRAVNSRLTAGRCAEMEREIRDLHPGLAAVKVSRNFLTGRAGIAAVPEEIVSAVLSDGATSYLGVTGRLIPERLSDGGTDPFLVELRAAPGKAPELAAFLSSVRPLASLFYSRPVALTCEGRKWECSFRLEDGTTVLWGGFEFTRLKILRLNEVMGDACLKKSGPLRADLRSFREGKIFVSAVKQAVPPKKPAGAGAL